MREAFEAEGFTYSAPVLARIAIREFKRIDKPKVKKIKPFKVRKSNLIELEKLAGR